MKIYVVGHSKNYASWIKDASLTDDMKEADIVLFTGGEDVSPILYGEKEGRFTSTNPMRDAIEQKEFTKAWDLEKPMIGICRGSQFLCVMAGGRLVQDQQNKHYVHPITTNDGKELHITSTHHQAQYPYDLDDVDFELIGWTENTSKYHLNGDDKEISDQPFKEVEIAYYSKINALCIQGHPEYDRMSEYPDTLEYLNGLISKYLIKK